MAPQGEKIFPGKVETTAREKSIAAAAGHDGYHCFLPASALQYHHGHSSQVSADVQVSFRKPVTKAETH